MNRPVAALAGLFVAFLWSTSYILMKWAYALELKPLTLGGIRFGLATLILLPLWILKAKRRFKTGNLIEGATILKIPLWLPMVLGFAGYTVTVGGQNIGLYFLKAHQVTLVLAVHNTIQCLIWSYILIREKPSALQGLALFVALLGIALYYYPWRFGQKDVLGIPPLLVAGLGYGLWTVGNRHWIGKRGFSALELAIRSMGWGGLFLLVLAFVFEGFPRLSVMGMVILLVLAAINTAFAFTLWTKIQGVLTAYESVMINNTMVVQIALLSFFLLHENPTGLQWGSIVIVSIGVLLVQLTPEIEARWRISRNVRRSGCQGKDRH